MNVFEMFLIQWPLQCIVSDLMYNCTGHNVMTIFLILFVSPAFPMWYHNKPRFYSTKLSDTFQSEPTFASNHMLASSPQVPVMTLLPVYHRSFFGPLLIARPLQAGSTQVYKLLSLVKLAQILTRTLFLFYICLQSKISCPLTCHDLRSSLISGRYVMCGWCKITFPQLWGVQESGLIISSSATKYKKISNLVGDGDGHQTCRTAKWLSLNMEVPLFLTGWWFTDKLKLFWKIIYSGLHLFMLNRILSRVRVGSFT